jgi:general secretion pathway protein D
LKSGQERGEKRMKKAHYSLMLLVLVIAFPVMINKGFAQTTTMFVDPANVQDIAVGNTFDITLKVADVQELYAWQTQLLWDPAILACQKAVIPSTGYVFEGKASAPVTPVIDNVTGSLLYGASLLGDIPRFSGSGSMTTVTFKVLATGSSPLNFSLPYGENTFLLDYDFNVLSSTLQNGFFTNVPQPPQERHDVAVTGLSVSNDHPKQGQNVTITVDVKNNGTLPETFNVQLTNDTIVIGVQAVTALASGASATLTFVWNTSAATIGRHTITATATDVPSDTDPANNAASVAVTVVSSTGPSTDLNGDGQVDIKDVAVVGKALGTQEGDSRWNPAADVNGDTIVNIIDVALVCKDFGRIL